MRSRLREVLEESRRLGFLGPMPVEAHVAQAEDLAALLAPAPRRFLDLGSGGGVPGLVLALAWPEAEAVLLDAGRRRGAFLTAAVVDLGLEGRVGVVTARAEQAARAPGLRAGFPLVVARSFGSPAVTAECAVGFLLAGGRLAVTEPPTGEPGARWPAAVAELGLRGPEIRRGVATTVALLDLDGPVDDRWPRRTGVPAKRPLW